MTWTIDANIILPHGGPQLVKRRVLRKQEADKLLEKFPLPVDLGPDSFKLQIKGLISPALLADQLWEVVKKAGQESIQIQITGEPEFEFFAGRYTVNKADSGVKKPMFDENGKLVQEYDITFIAFTEQGDTQDIDTGDKILDEPGIGFGDFEDIFDDFADFIIPGFTDLFTA